MATAPVLGQGTTFNLPNHVGTLYNATPNETPLMSLIGAVRGGEGTTSTIFTWGGFDLRDADHRRQRLEGADAPEAENRKRFAMSNVVEIHQETVDISYTKQAAIGQHADVGSNHPQVAGVAGMNPVSNEETFQRVAALQQIGRDIEASLWNGKKHEPTDNTTPRRMGGILEATATNVVEKGTLLAGGSSAIADDGTVAAAAHGLSDGDAVVVRESTGGPLEKLVDNQLYYVVEASADSFKLAKTAGGGAVTFATAGTGDFYVPEVLTDEMLGDMVQLAYDNGGMRGDMATLMVNSTLKRKVSDIYKDHPTESRTVGGVNIQQIITDFGTLNVVLASTMPSGVVWAGTLNELQLRFLFIPGKGYLFEEPLSNVGASDRTQIYGEVGLEWGNELKHAQIVGVRR